MGASRQPLTHRNFKRGALVALVACLMVVLVWSGSEVGTPPPTSPPTIEGPVNPSTTARMDVVVVGRVPCAADDDCGDDTGDWLWDTSPANPRLSTPHFLPPNIRLLIADVEDAPSVSAQRTTLEAFQLAVHNIRQCRAIDGGANASISPFVKALARHLFRQYEEDVQRRVGAPFMRRPRLIYNCESNRMGRFCGGMGDRFRGMVSAFYLSLLSNRRFELFHPVAVPLQRYLRPHLLNWIPTASNRAGVAGITALETLLRELDQDSALMNPDMSMMRIKGHAAFLKKLDKAGSTPTSTSAQDIRIQTNSVGVDGFLDPTKTPRLWENRKEAAVGGAAQSAPDAAAFGLSSYYGCLFEVLFQPSPALLRSVEGALGPTIASLGNETAKDRGDSERGHPSAALGYHSDVAGAHRRYLEISQPFVGMQVRMGGSWATGMLVKEPFRTSPDAVDDFFAMAEDVLTATSLVLPHRARWPIFVSSDSERFVRQTVVRFGEGNVRFVQGGFNHTDTLNFNEAKQGGPRAISSAQQVRQRRSEYLKTLTNHFVLGLSNHLVMAQSGFGDTAYWRSRREASCIFVDMKGLRTARQHHQSYQPKGVAASIGVVDEEGRADIRRLVPLARAIASANSDRGLHRASEGGAPPSPLLTVARTTCNRVIDVSAPVMEFYSTSCPS